MDGRERGEQDAGREGEEGAQRDVARGEGRPEVLAEGGRGAGRGDREAEDHADEAAEGPLSDAYATEQRVAFITGTADLENGWQNYIDSLYAMGLQTYVDIAQTAYTRMNS